jgi:hypothetical protein
MGGSESQHRACRKSGARRYGETHARLSPVARRSKPVYQFRSVFPQRRTAGTTARETENNQPNLPAMKTIITSLMSLALAAFTLSPNVSAAEKEMAKAVTLEGTATCAKCDLETEKECTSVLQVKEGDKTVTYYLAGIIDKEWHKKICKTAKAAKMTGTVTEEDGKKTLVVSKVDMIEEAKAKE